MKSFNQIMFLCSIAMVGGASGMEKMASGKQGKWFVELDNKLVEYYTGNNIRYYKEYHANAGENNMVLFSVENTDPLPIDYFGEKRFFVTSATTGSVGNMGEACMILDPAIKQLAVVRGVARSNNNGVNVYMGLNTDNVKLFGYKGRDRIYPTRVMMLQTKAKCGSDSGYSWYHNYKIVNEVKHFGAHEIGMEVRKYLSLNDCGWKNPLFQATVKELLGKRAQGFRFELGCFYNRESYWTDKENKLKGITYHSNK
jgi:hypothetical protein